MNIEEKKEKQIKLQQIFIFPILLLDIWSQEQRRLQETHENLKH